MWATKTAASALLAAAFVPSVFTFWDKSQPVVTDFETKPLFLGPETYRVALYGDLRDGCTVEDGSARLVALPDGPGDLGEWEFNLEDSDTNAVSLQIRLVCRKRVERTQTLGPIEVRSPITGKVKPNDTVERSP